MTNRHLVPTRMNFHRIVRSYLLLLFLPISWWAVKNHQALAARVIHENVDPENVHAIIVSSSRYWFNYRHAINALGMYEIYRQNGIPDENVILMIADEFAVNARNPFKNRMHAEGIHRTGWYNNETEIDYRGSDVSVQMFMDALLGNAPKSLKNLNANSNLMIYVTGHGGDQFFKFQDEEELMAKDIANLMDKMYEEGKFGKALFIADTCQAFTLFDKVTTPNVMALGTSLIDESAYAHHSDNDLGLSVIERWTHYFIENYHKRSDHQTTLHQAMVAPFADKRVLMARVGIKDDTSRQKFKNTKLSDFFGTKGGRPSVDIPDQTDPIVEISRDTYLKLPHLAREEDATNENESKPPEESSINVCSAQDSDCESNIFSVSGFYVCICGFVVAFFATRKLENQLLG